MTGMMGEGLTSLPNGVRIRNSHSLAFSEASFQLERKREMIIITLGGYDQVCWNQSFISEIGERTERHAIF